LTNWAQAIAADLSAVVENVAIYSNVDPTREFNGATSIEVNVNSVERVPLISGGAFVDYNVVIACRALTFDAAAALAVDVKDKVATIIDALVADNSIVSGVLTSLEVTPDLRGITEGESFYGVINLTLTEKEL
jgi:hypothetical protein